MKDSLLAHHKRWNIESSTEDALKQFRYRVIQGTTQSNLNISYQQVARLNYFAGSNVYSALAMQGAQITLLVNVLNGVSSSASTFTNLLQLLFFVFEESENHTQLDAFYEIVQDALGFTPKVELEMTKSGNSVLLYPAGAELLDQAVINQTLNWLESYPDALSPFAEALKLYELADSGKNRNVLDNLRFSLEQFLKEILQNSKSLENQQEALLSWLKNKKVHQQIINMYRHILFGPFSKFHNDAVKHEAQYAEQDVEFMIYLTGTFIRFLLQVEKT